MYCHPSTRIEVDRTRGVRFEPASVRSNCAMRVSELRAYFNNHPKAPREASRSRKDWLREMFATPPETSELLRALKS